MTSVEQQLAEYFELQDELHSEITPGEIVGPPVRVLSARRSLSGAWWAAAAAAAVVGLAIGTVALLGTDRSADDATTDSSTPSSVVPETDALAIAEEFMRGRVVGEPSIVALLAEGAVVDVGPASAPNQLVLEMEWQRASGLSFEFERCEAANASNAAGPTVVTCTVSWTGAVPAALGFPPDTFVYEVGVANGMIVSLVLADLGDYSTTTWRPFRDWVRENHPSDIAVMYMPDWHAVLTDESIELWAVRTAEFVAAQGAPATSTTEAPTIYPFVEQGQIELEWVSLRSSDTQPYGIESYVAGLYSTTAEDGVYTSEDAITWFFEATPQGEFVPDDISEDGRWGMDAGFFTGTLLEKTAEGWEVAARPPQADQSGDWVWHRHLESVGDVLVVLGGPPDRDTEPPANSSAGSSYWRIDSSGRWAEVLDWDGTFFVDTIPGGFAYVKDGSLVTSVDGLTWAAQGPARFTSWESGFFPNRIHATVVGTGGEQVWSSSDAVNWRYEFTMPEAGDSWQNLSPSNQGFVATRLVRDSLESWLLSEDRRTWSRMTTFAVPSCGRCESAIVAGAEGDVVFVSRPTADSSGFMHVAVIPEL